MADYDITQLKSLKHDTVQGTHNSLVKIDDTHYALAYSEYAGGNYKGFIKTFSIDGSYNITQLASLKHDADSGTYNSLVKIDDTHFMLAYAGFSNRGHIKTFSIDGSYNITQLKSLEHDGMTGTYNSLVKIDDTHFILASCAGFGRGHIKTFSIDGSYNITQLKSLEHDGMTGTYNSLVKIDDTHFMLAYVGFSNGSGSSGHIKTFSIDGSYNVTQLKFLRYDEIVTHNSLVKIDDTHYALAYTEYAGGAYKGFIKTFSIDGSYNITQLKSLEHDANNGTYNSLVKIDDTHFILAYTGSGDDGYIKTFSIDITQIASLEHDTNNGTFNSLVKIDDTHFMLTYAGDGSGGFIKTFFVETPVKADESNFLLFM